MEDIVAAVVLLDLTVVYLLQIGAAKLYGRRSDPVRALIGSSVAALHSGLATSGIFPVIDRYTVRIAVLTVTGFLVFGYKRDGIRKVVAFILLNAALEGVVNGHALSVAPQRVAVSVLIALLCRVLHKKERSVCPYAHIKIRYRGRTVHVKAFRDTGNGLKDIVTGGPVLVIGPDVAFRLTGLSREELSAPLETMEDRPIEGLRLIPFSSVGHSHDLMLAVRSRDTVIDGVRSDMVIAMAPEGMGRYEALIGGDHDTWDHQ